MSFVIASFSTAETIGMTCSGGSLGRGISGSLVGGRLAGEEDILFTPSLSSMLPKPSLPLVVGARLSTSIRIGVLAFSMTICAILSPRWSVYASFPKLCKTTCCSRDQSPLPWCVGDVLL